MLAEGEGPHWLARFARNFTYLFALLLWAGAVFACSAARPALAIAIVVVIVVNAIFSFAQEYRAERAVEALRRILPQRVRVRRDGHPREITAEEVVPGDVHAARRGRPGLGRRRAARRGRAQGRHVDADRRVAPGAPPRGRGPARPRGLEAPDRVFAGTHVVAGTGRRGTATGMATELGRIAELTQQARVASARSSSRWRA